MHGCRGNREDFIRLLNRQGIDVVFRENDEGRIYGATFIDHRNREVYNGSRLGKEFSANAFERLFNEPGRLSGSSTLKQTVPTRRKRLLPEGCNARRKRNAVHGVFPENNIHSPLKLYSYATGR